MFKVGQKVWCVIYGEGTVVSEIQDAGRGVYPVLVVFKSKSNKNVMRYTEDGKYYSDGNVTLFPYPVNITKAITKPSIDWSHVSENFQYLAMDEGGSHHLFAEKPEPIVLEWAADAPYIRAEHFASFTPGTCNWLDSLVKRPE